MTEHSPTAMPEERDEFHIDDVANAAAKAPEIVPGEFVNPPGQPDELTEVDEHGEPLVEATLIEQDPEEHGFAMVEAVLPRHEDRMLMFEELRGLAGAAAAAAERRGANWQEKAKRQFKRAIIATAIAAGLGSAAPQSAEAGQRGDKGRRIATIISIASEVGGAVFQAKAERHAQMARELAQLERRFDQLSRRLDTINGRIERANQRAKDRESRGLSVSIGSSQDLESQRNQILRELDQLADILDQAAKEGKTARSEAEKARSNAMRASISQRVEQEARRAQWRGW